MYNHSSKFTVDKFIQQQMPRLSEKERNQQGYRCARLYYSCQEYDLAIKYVSSYLTVVPDSATAHRLLAECLEKVNRKDAALRSYRTAIELDPSQKDLLLKVCELMAQDDTALDQSYAEVWCDRAKEFFPNHPSLFALRERIVQTNNKTGDTGDELEQLILSELEECPTDISLRIRLLRHLLHTNKVKDAYKHAYDLENLKYNIFADNLSWYETVSECLIRYQRENVELGYQFWVFLITVLDKVASLSLDEQSAKNISDCTTAVFNFDQMLNLAVQNIPKCNAGGVTVDRLLLQEFTIHYLGQLCLHLAVLNYKREKLDKENCEKYLIISVLLGAWSSPPPEISAGWLAQTESEQIRKWVNRWYLEACFRASQSGHLLLQSLGDRRSNYFDQLAKNYSKNWRERFYKVMFVNRDQLLKLQSSFFITCPQLHDMRALLPGSVELALYDETAQLLHPSSLHHIIWLGLNSKLPEFKCTIFDGLQYSINNLKNCAAETLNQLDILAFIYCATICARNFYGPNKTPLPVCLTERICTHTQESWFSASYKVFQKQYEGSDLGNLRLTLIHGIESIRCVGNHGLHVGLLVELAKLFAAHEEFVKESTKREFIGERAMLYWNTAIPLLERMKGNQVVKYPTKDKLLFDYRRERDLTSIEISNYLEEGKLYLACKLKEQNEYDRALEMFQNLKSPYATFYQAQIYKKLAQQQIKQQMSEHVTSEMRSQHIIFLSKARDCFYLTLDRLREPHVDRKHPLNLELGTEIETIEAQLSQIDPDLNDVDNISNVSSVSDQHRNRTLQINSTPYRNFSRGEARPSPERLEAQIRQIVTKDSVVTNILEQNRQLLDNYKKLCDEIRDLKDEFKSTGIGGVLHKVRDDLADIKIGLDQIPLIKKELQEMKKDLQDLKKEGKICEQDLYDVLEEDYRSQVNYAPQQLPGMFHYPVYGYPQSFDQFPQATLTNAQATLTGATFPKTPPVNVVITSSDPVPTQTISTSIPQLSVTIPAHHLKKTPHNYQIPLPVPIPQLTQPPLMTPLLPVTTQNLLSNYSSPKYSSITSTSLTEPEPEEHIEEHDPCPDFVPICPLPDEVEVKTGEEGETVLFKERGKLFRWVDKEWKERGVGDLKILHNLETKKVRILMRRDQVHKICANHLLTSDMELQTMPTSDRAFVWAANDFADEEMRLEKLSIRFKTPEQAAQFKIAFNKAKKLVVDTPSEKSLSEKPEKETKAKTVIQTPTKPAATTPKASDVTGSPLVKPAAVLGGFTFSSAPIFSNVTKPTQQEEVAKAETKPNPFSNFTFGTPQTTTEQKTPAKSSILTGLLSTPSILSTLTPKSTTTTPTSTTQITSPEKVDEFTPTTEFTPVIPLPDLVDAKTGEEDETILFCERAKLFRFDTNTKEWKERGLGEMKILASGIVRLLMRREHILKICCNHQVTKTMEFKKVQGNDKAIRWAAQDYSDLELKSEVFTCRFKTADLAEDFLNALETVQEDMDEGNFIEDKSTPDTSPIKNEKPKDFSEFKPKAGQWECTVCYIQNNSTDDSCTACTTPREESKVESKPKTSWGDQFKPKAGSWGCKACYINNQADALLCIACNSPKDPNAVPKKEEKSSLGTGITFDSNGPKFSFGIPPKTDTAAKSENILGKLQDLSEFKPKVGSWECKTCYISNTSSAQHCVACNEPKDPSIPKKDTSFAYDPNTPKFTFGIQPTTTNAVFGTPTTSVSNNATITTPKFGGTPVFGNSTPLFGTSTATPTDLSTKPTFGFQFNKNTPVLGATAPVVVSSATGLEAGEPASEPAEHKYTFGSPDKFGFVFKPRSPRKSESGGGDESDGEPEEDEGEHIYFKPLIPLPEKVEVKTGEEDEEVLYCHRAKLFRFVDGEWKERGVGDVKILKHKDTSKLRVIMRRDPIMKICLNHALTSDVIYRVKDDKSWLFGAADFSEGQIEHQQFCIRFKTPTIANEFKAAIDSSLSGTPTLSIKETEQLESKENDSGDECELITPRISDEYLEKAKLLQLPEFFYLYTVDLVPKCPGCVGCDPDAYDFNKKAAGELNIPVPAKSSMFSFSDEYKILNKIEESGGNQLSATPKPLFGNAQPKTIFGSASGQNVFGAANYSFGSKLLDSPAASESPTQSSETPNIFGNKTPPSSVLKPPTFSFGSNSPNLFSKTDSTPIKPTNIFQTQPANIFTGTPTSGNLFSGSPAPVTTATSIFGGSPAPTSANLFSGSSAPNSVFGSKSIFGSGATTGTTSIFGGSPAVATTTSATSIFGGSPAVATTTSATSIFGGSPAVVTTTSTTSIFGGSPAVVTTNTTSIFGGSPAVVTTTSTPSLFGGAPANTTSLFGAPVAATSAPTLFGATNIFGGSPAVGTKVKEGLLGNSPATVVPAEPATGHIFGSVTTMSSGIPAGNMFGTSKDNVFGATNNSSVFGGALKQPTFGTAATETANVFSGPKTQDPVGAKTDDNGIFGLKTDTATVDFASLATKTENQPPAFSASSSFQFEGAGQPVFASLKPKSDTKTEDDENDPSNTTDPEHYDPHYEPIVPLPDKIVVSTGEEDEEKVYSQRAKLYRYDANLKEWKERGVGDMKILHHPERGTYRFVLRREQVHKLVLNQLLRADLELRKLNSSNQAYCWGGMNYAEESGGNLEELAIRFKNEQIAEQFVKAVDECRVKLKEMVPTTIAECLSEQKGDDEETGSSYNDEDDEDEEDYDGEEADDYDDDDDEDYPKSVMCDKPCSLYEESNGKFEPLANGNAQIIYDTESFFSRICVVAEDGEVITNSPIFKDTTLHQEEDHCVWIAVEDIINPNIERKLKAKFETKEDATEFYLNYKEGIELAQ